MAATGDCDGGKLSDSPAANWRFGDKQTPEQEQAEIKRARRDGLEAVYVELQAWVNARRGGALPHLKAKWEARES